MQKETLNNKKQKASDLKKIENKLLKYYNPDGSFEWAKCAKWIWRQINAK